MDFDDRIYYLIYHSFVKETEYGHRIKNEQKRELIKKLFIYIFNQNTKVLIFNPYYCHFNVLSFLAMSRLLLSHLIVFVLYLISCLLMPSSSSFFHCPQCWYSYTSALIRIWPHPAGSWHSCPGSSSAFYQVSTTFKILRLFTRTEN